MKNKIEIHNNAATPLDIIEYLLDDIRYEEALHSNKLAFYRPLDHTMGYSIDKYVQQRIPTKLIEHAIIEGMPIKLHGIYPEHLQALKHKLQITEHEEYFFLPNKKCNKQFNKIRPRYFICTEKNGQKCIYILVTPGSDYMYHYASMLQHILALLSNSSKKLLKIYRYPKLENNITLWTNLDNSFIKKGDIVVLGCVNEIRLHLTKYTSIHPISRHENSYYCSARYQLGNKIINFLGVHYSFWGNISSNISTTCCELGASEIIYIAKQGSLHSPEDLYRRVFSATSYLTMDSLNIMNRTTTLDNPITKLFPELDSGCHLSVPTVLEEGYRQREKAAKYDVQSIDNEISQIAHAVDNFNKKSKSNNVKFFNLHFATDYIRTKEERNITTEFDLSNNRSKRAVELKQKILIKISNYFYQYLMTT